MMIVGVNLADAGYLKEYLEMKVLSNEPLVDGVYLIECL